MISRVWQSVVNWFERGDLIPLLVLVSAVHYANILAEYDYWAVAVAIGLLVDLGHYRIIREAMTYTGTSKKGITIRWTFAAMMTGMSLAYHQMFYNNFWLSAPLPLLIAALAWLQRVDRKPIEKVTKPIETIETQSVGPAKPYEPLFNVTKSIETLTNPINIGYEVTKSDGIAYGNIAWIGKPTCTICGYVAKNQNALNSHKRKHKDVVNG